jgi:arylsulfatase A-like enzyme
MRRLPCPLVPPVLLLAWLGVTAPRTARAAPAGTDGPPPVILISIDTLRADHLSCYGYSRLGTPHIDSLQRGGTVFAEVSAQAPITLPSHVSLFTSTYPFANGIRENAQILPLGAVTLATVLAAHGYNTAAFIGGFSLERRYGLAQGFQTYDSPFDTRIMKGALDLKRPASQVLDSAEHWLRHNSGGPFLLFVHLFDLHQPYDAPAAYRTRAPASEYDQELAYVDDSLGGFFGFLARSGLDQRPLVVLFSDHGESLGEHGENTHGYFIYGSTLHVPLIFHWPRGRDYPARVDAPAGLIDVAPTVLSFLGFQAPASFSGHTLLALAKGGESPPRDVYSESSYAHDKFGWAGLRSLRRGDYQYLDAPRPELYDLKHDAAELHNLLPGQSALAATYRERLAALVATYRSVRLAGPPVPAAAAEAAQNLRALGYLDATTPHAALADSGIDPKDRLFEYKRYLLAEHLEQTGRSDEAAAEFQAILADDARNLPAYLELARADGALHRYLDGERELKAALALDPQNAEAEELLGDMYLAAGDHGRAEAEFHHLLTFAPQDYEAHFGLGLIARRQGQTAEATTQFRAALAADPRSAEAHYQLGLILEAESHIQEAVGEFEAALQIDPHLPEARRELAKLTSQRQR